MSYKKALNHFLSLPEDQRKLDKGQYYSATTKCYCAIGSLAPTTKDIPEFFNTRNITSIWHDAMVEKETKIEKVVCELENLGLTRYESAGLQDTNDCIQGTPEQRYIEVVKFLTEKVAEESRKARAILAR